MKVRFMELDIEIYANFLRLIFGKNQRECKFFFCVNIVKTIFKQNRKQ